MEYSTDTAQESEDALRSVQTEALETQVANHHQT